MLSSERGGEWCVWEQYIHMSAEIRSGRILEVHFYPRKWRWKKTRRFLLSLFSVCEMIWDRDVKNMGS
jgi:hypothetical protein